MKAFSENNITIDKVGNATVFGALAMKLYWRADFPRSIMGLNRFFVYEPDGKLIAAQSTFHGACRYAADNRILVSIQ